MRLGFACNWDPDPRATWSGTPWRLLEALREQADVADVGLRLPAAPRAALKALHARRREGRWVSAWKHSAAMDRTAALLVSRKAAAARCDAVLEVGDLAALRQPFYVLQDLSYEVLARHWEAEGVPHFPMLDRDRLRRRAERQRELYGRAAGVLALSGWLATTLVEWSGLPAAKVHVVHPGTEPPAGAPPERPPPRRRLLFVGKDFATKGGDLVLAALALLRRDEDVRLTVAGPATWPLPGPVPPGVRFLGRLPRDRALALYDRHDLLVMPSWLEGFGLVFLEALARGLPCVGRRACAMPELIVPGTGGDLVDGDDPEALAATVARLLGDDGLYRRCRDQAPAIVERFSWRRSAGAALAAMGAAPH